MRYAPGEVVASEALLMARSARRSAASRLSSACWVESQAVAAARRSALFGRPFVGCVDTVILCLAAITISLELLSCASGAFACCWPPGASGTRASTAVRASAGVSADGGPV
jgi:hypothetical protein